MLDYTELMFPTVCIVVGALAAYWLSHQGRT